ncbi:MAG: helix-turn-helix transcriptional regulator [Desulfuromonadales bacterium]
MNMENNDESASTVCLDSVEVKRIREGLQLTQLYVSKVVGVTTDTISRWENNRYPTIRRENALKLAEALEVSLADILLKPVAETVLSEDKGDRKSAAAWMLTSTVIVLALIALFVYSRRLPIVPAANGERVLPGFAAPGSVIPVLVALTDRTDNSGIIAREYFPVGWKLIQANPPTSSLDNVKGVARWIIKAGDDRDRIVYLVQVDSLAKPDSVSRFKGEIVASSQGSQSAVSIQGKNEIVVAPIHWADTDGNGQINDGEMLEASFTIEDMAGVHIDWNDLEKLWAAGSYAWNRKQGKFLPKSP